MSTTESVSQIEHILAPLAAHHHATLVLEQVFPLLQDARAAFGDERVAQELVDATKAGYEAVPAKHLEYFWRWIPRGVEDGVPKHQDEFRQANEGRLNADLAATFGVANAFGPIIDLMIVHHQTNVFGTDKFLCTHANRMGNVLTMFGQEQYRAYIELAKTLLRGRVYDWTIEMNRGQWELLAPIVRKHGVHEVMSPFVRSAVALSDLPGTKDHKYKYSFLALAFRELSPYFVTVVLADSHTGAIMETLDGIVQLVREIAKEGAFATEPHPRGCEVQFFESFGKKVRSLMRDGTEKTLATMRQEWTHLLVR